MLPNTHYYRCKLCQATSVTPFLNYDYLCKDCEDFRTRTLNKIAQSTPDTLTQQDRDDFQRLVDNNVLPKYRTCPGLSFGYMCRRRPVCPNKSECLIYKESTNV